MTLRSGHGRGAGAPRVEVLPGDELPAASPAIAAPRERDALGRFVRGNTAARAQRVRPGPRGLVGVDKCSPDFRPFARWGARYGAHRRRELASAHGGEISAGVGAIIESAALAMAASRYLHVQASIKGEADLFKQAAQLAQTARQHELAAWELAAREAAARRDAEGDDLAQAQRAFQERLAERQAAASSPATSAPALPPTTDETTEDDDAAESRPGAALANVARARLERLNGGGES
ncbi:MAG: hypothetical protein KC776_12280 [Myxococcales bacterium]|nr:hypothetical protein [Myxococcales bacterium]MCB9580995.1 hypothetical protein [Polyangiaceae bacterium]